LLINTTIPFLDADNAGKFLGYGCWRWRWQMAMAVGDGFEPSTFDLSPLTFDL